MQHHILELSVLSVVCGAVMSITPEGGTKKVSQILSTAILITSILSFAGEINLEEYVSCAADINERKNAFAENVEESEQDLTCLVIKDHCIEYIMDKADEYDIKLSDVRIQMYQSQEKEYIPYSIDIIGQWENLSKNDLAELIYQELGLPRERQYWHHE